MSKLSEIKPLTNSKELIEWLLTLNRSTTQFFSLSATSCPIALYYRSKLDGCVADCGNIATRSENRATSNFEWRFIAKFDSILQISFSVSEVLDFIYEHFPVE